MKFYFSITLICILSTGCFRKPEKCTENFKWNLEESGVMTPKIEYQPTDFVFVSSDEIIIANLPTEGIKTAPLQLFRKVDNKWQFQGGESASLAEAYHPRHIHLADVDGDGIKEVLVADHGIDVPPYPGALPIILRKDNNKWVLDKNVQSLGEKFTFNTAVLPLDNQIGIYRANVDFDGFSYFVLKEGSWIDQSHLFPSEKLCMMTALSEDLDGDGVKDLYLGGCDNDTKLELQKNDRVLVWSNGKWNLLPSETIPERKNDSRWGTVFVNPTDLNEDGKPDLMLAKHDYGFHDWKIVFLQNESTSGEFKFKEIEIPLDQERNTEGFVYHIQDFKIKNSGSAYFAEVRSILRDPNKREPEKYLRFFIQRDGAFKDVSACVPNELQENYYKVRRYPDSDSKLLFIPNEGKIYTLEIEKPIK